MFEAPYAFLPPFLSPLRAPPFFTFRVSGAACPFFRQPTVRPGLRVFPPIVFFPLSPRSPRCRARLSPPLGRWHPVLPPHTAGSYRPTAGSDWTSSAGFRSHLPGFSPFLERSPSSPLREIYRSRGGPSFSLLFYLPISLALRHSPILFVF